MDENDLSSLLVYQCHLWPSSGGGGGGGTSSSVLNIFIVTVASPYPVLEPQLCSRVVLRAKALLIVLGSFVNGWMDGERVV